MRLKTETWKTAEISLGLSQFFKISLYLLQKRKLCPLQLGKWFGTY